MQAAARVFVEVFDVRRRLQELGLTIDLLLDAIRVGFVGRSTCTELDPPMYAGQTMWALTLRGLRQRTAPLGWKMDNTSNYCTSVSPDGRMAIAVSTGDAETGNANGNPSTNSAKGPCTVDAVAANQLSLDLQLPGEKQPLATVGDEQRQTWLLLIHVGMSDVRAELSLPFGMDEEGRVSSWCERLILPSIDFDPNQIELPSSEPAGDIDIDVRRRA